MSEVAQHVTVDCGTGETATRLATPEEVAAQEQAQQAFADAAAKAAAEREADMKLLSDRAAQDPTFAALLRVLRVSVS